jgi:hypothetical protein
MKICQLQLSADRFSDRKAGHPDRPAALTLLSGAITGDSMIDQTISKYCLHCKQIKPATEFYKNRGNRDSLYSYCKVCQCAAVKAYRQTENGKETKRRGARKYRQSKKGRQCDRRYRLNHPEKAKARDAVTHAIRDGRLASAKTLQCHYCGKQAQQYHHYLGYAPEHWFDVIPVCKQCHREVHKELRKAIYYV